MDLAFQLRASLLAQSLPPPSTAFISSLVAARSPPPPLPSLLATARARLLACDLCSSSLVDAALLCPLPAQLDAPALRLPRDVHVQVVDVENMSIPRWDQAQKLQAIAQGQEKRGRQVVRVQADAPDAPGASSSASSSSSSAAAAAAAAAGANATHRLVLQDRQGTRVYAVELRRDMRIGIGKTNIGEKIVLRAGTSVARGIVLLSPETCLLLGGKVEAWHNAWVEGRLARLMEAVGCQAQQ
ncbi:hypothetical protein CDD82_6413 [Ophiocordyceps australis]|uniref:Uncharacterized protein n=1 Tax=Ophiocordyceps australis TaxID=1399860 RepID=A0A2C5ZJZ3_9HYPO|nr:hypothetical protein CDD82_6413 [Ophiocordyceps australis]